MPSCRTELLETCNKLVDQQGVRGTVGFKGLKNVTQVVIVYLECNLSCDMNSVTIFELGIEPGDGNARRDYESGGE